MTIKAVVFDIGGVCVASPLHAINMVERRMHLPHNYLNHQIARWQSPSPLQRLEMGDIARVDEAFFEAFGAHLSDPAGYDAYLAAHPAPAAATTATDMATTSDTATTTTTTNSSSGRNAAAPTIDGKDLWRVMMEAAAVPNEPMLREIQRLRNQPRRTLKIWALTNNFPETLATDKLVHAHFDRIIGSVQMRMRKPDPRIFTYLVKELDLEPHEIVRPPSSSTSPSFLPNLCVLFCLSRHVTSRHTR